MYGNSSRPRRRLTGAPVTMLGTITQLPDNPKFLNEKLQDRKNFDNVELLVKSGVDGAVIKVAGDPITDAKFKNGCFDLDAQTDELVFTFTYELNAGGDNV